LEKFNTPFGLKLSYLLFAAAEQLYVSFSPKEEHFHCRSESAKAYFNHMPSTEIK